MEDDEFYNRLKPAVMELLKNSSKVELMNAFYRLDLSESSIMSAFNTKDIDHRADILTRSIIARTIQKQKTRNNTGDKLK